ncbi:MAG: hypothetical protein ABIQ11_09555, partial [Saprospiraceae bacterium]
GFQTMTVPMASLIDQRKNIQLTEEPISLDQVVIVVPFHQLTTDDDDQSVSLNGYQFFSTEDLLSSEAERLINNLTGYSHFSSEHGIRIRGSDAENALFVMDEIPVYDPYHFYNIFSPFNGNYFSSLDIYKNNIPVEYGGRIDGMIRLSSEQLYKNESELMLESDLLLSSMAGKWAITDKIGFSAAGRVSHTALLDDALSQSTNIMMGGFRDENEWSSTQQPGFNFYDINLGLTAELGNRYHFSISFFKNKDYLDNAIDNSFQTSGFFQETILVHQTIVSRDDWQNEGAAVNFSADVNSKTTLHASGFLSGYKKNITYSSLLVEERNEMMRTSSNAGFQNSNLRSGGLKLFVMHQQENESGLTAGIDFQHHQADLVAKENNTPYLLQVQSENEITGFGEYNFVFKKVNFAAGGRLTYLSSTEKIYAQPNLRFNYDLSDMWRLKLAYSKNIQAVRDLTVENRFGREVDFLALSSPVSGYPVLKSDKFMAGATCTAGNFILDAELYYKKTTGLISVRAPKPDPSFDDETSPDDFYRLFVGDGWTGGLDLLAVYKSKKTETSLSYTLSKISRNFDLLFNGNSFSPKEDRRHQLKLSHQVTTGRFTSSGLLNYKTKAPYISLVRLEGSGIGMIDQGTVLKYLPAYFSLDLGLDYSFTLLKNAAQIGVSLINATNHENINDLQHIGRVSRNSGGNGGLFLTSETELLGRTFNVHFRYLLK